MRKKHFKIILHGSALLLLGLFVQHNKESYFGNESPGILTKYTGASNNSSSPYSSGSNSTGFLSSDISNESSFSENSYSENSEASNGSGSSGGGTAFGHSMKGSRIVSETSLQNNEIALSAGGSSYSMEGAGSSMSLPFVNIKREKEKEKNKPVESKSIIRTNPFPNAGISSGSTDVIMAFDCENEIGPPNECPVPLDDYYFILIFIGGAFGIFKLRSFNVLGTADL